MPSATNAVTNILENLNGVAAQGVGIGLMTIVGQCIGAGRKDEAIYYIKKLSKMAEVAIIISCLVVFALCRPITILGGMEAESARMCFEMTLFITITKPISWVLSFIPAYGMRLCRRREIFNDNIMCKHVVMSCKLYYILMPCIWLWSLLLYGLECLPTGLCAVSCSLYVSTPADGLIII